MRLPVACTGTCASGPTSSIAAHPGANMVHPLLQLLWLAIVVSGGTFPSAKYYACQQPPSLDGPPAAATTTPPWCDVRQAIGNRSVALAAAMNATELVRYVLGGAVGRLGVPTPPHYGEEALHGVSVGKCPFPDRCTTVFPPASGSARSFNRTLWRAIGAAIGLEARTLWNTQGGALSLRGPQLNLQVRPSTQAG
jgi:hypothetical protein